MKKIYKVESSAINSVAYDNDTNILTIEFKQGAEYDYPNVPLSEVIDLVNAPSVGKYFNTHIKQYSTRVASA